MSNWHFECPFCQDEQECEVEEHSAPDGNWITTHIPNECMECERDLTPLWLELDEQIQEHYVSYNSRPPEKEWYEDYDWYTLEPLYQQEQQGNSMGQR